LSFHNIEAEFPSWWNTK